MESGLIKDVKRIMPSWESVEQETVRILTQGFPQFVVTHHGGHNPNAADVNIRGLVRGSEVSFNIEIKKMPSAAGVQLVLQRSLEDEGDAFTTEATSPLAPSLLRLANHYADRPNQKILLTGANRYQALEIFDTKYSNVDLLIGYTDKGYVVTETTVDSMKRVFNPYLTTRIKKSGSQSLPLRLREQVLTLLEPDFEVTQKGKRTFVGAGEAAEKDMKQAAQQRLSNLDDPSSLFVNPTGEIRCLGKTRNLNVLLSLGVRNNAVYRDEAELTEWVTQKLHSL